MDKWPKKMHVVDKFGLKKLKLNLEGQKLKCGSILPIEKKRFLYSCWEQCL